MQHREGKQMMLMIVGPVVALSQRIQLPTEVLAKPVPIPIERATQSSNARSVTWRHEVEQTYVDHFHPLQAHEIFLSFLGLTLLGRGRGITYCCDSFHDLRIQ